MTGSRIHDHALLVSWLVRVARNIGVAEHLFPPLRQRVCVVAVDRCVRNAARHAVRLSAGLPSVGRISSDATCSPREAVELRAPRRSKCETRPGRRGPRWQRFRSELPATVGRLSGTDATLGRLGRCCRIMSYA
jgi:hypothetical protein